MTYYVNATRAFGATHINLDALTDSHSRQLAAQALGALHDDDTRRLSALRNQLAQVQSSGRPSDALTQLLARIDDRLERAEL